jgi:transcription elongation factor Elf1
MAKQSKLMKCRGCGAQFQTYDQLIEHVVRVHNATCQICGTQTNSKEELLRHNREVHNVG